MSYDGFPAEGSPESLPCGATGYFDSTGYRCEECMAIWGSIGCDCSNRIARWKREEAAAKIKKST